MLVLSRKIGESLVIGDNITVTVNRTKGRYVSLGITAPREVKVIRGELRPSPAAKNGCVKNDKAAHDEEQVNGADSAE